MESKKKDQVDIIALENLGKVHTDSLSKANLLNNYFASVFTHKDLSHTPRISVN